jgi:two-component system chemotaxis response regulator CheB
MIVVGTSLGGLRALSILLQGLPAKGFPLPIAVVLHRMKDTESALPDVLRLQSPLPVAEVLDKDPILPGKVYIAPADYHLLVEPTHFSLSVDEPVRFARPSIDVLFESAADVFGKTVIGIILSGASNDGAAGAVRIKAEGGRVIIQDPAEAEGRIMPQAVLNAVNIDYILPLKRIGPLLLELTAHLT